MLIKNKIVILIHNFIQKLADQGQLAHVLYWARD